MSGTLALAAAIARMTQQELSALVSNRHIASPQLVRDPLSLALELLRQDSITRALRTLSATQLTVLHTFSGESPEQAANHSDAVAAQALQELRGLGLIGSQQVGQGDHSLIPIEDVQFVLNAMLANEQAALASVDEVHTQLQGIIAEHQSTHDADVSGWYGAAVTTVRRATSALRYLARNPIKLSRKGEPTVVSQREIASAVHCTPEEAARLLYVLRTANLLTQIVTASGSQLLRPSTGAAAWLTEPFAERWFFLAIKACTDIDNRVLQLLPLLHGNLQAASGSLLHNVYPLLPTELQQQAEFFAQTAEDLGLTVHGVLSPPANLLIKVDRESAYLAVLRDFPPVVAGVYVQPDLSIIVPGPLHAIDDAALAIIAESEQLGAAAALRISATSLSRAMHAGFSTQEINALLTRLSLTGIPQPLSFMLADLDRTIGTQAQNRRFEAVLELAAEDPPALGNTGTETAAVHLKLIDLVATVFDAAQSSEDTGQISRLIELAIRNRTIIQVHAAAGAEEREFTLLPLAISGGRLRAIDQKAGVQRTLPLTAITSVK